MGWMWEREGEMGSVRDRGSDGVNVGERDGVGEGGRGSNGVEWLITNNTHSPTYSRLAQ